MRTIRLATPDDLDDVLKLLAEAALWLRSRGLDQWPDPFGPDRIGPMIRAREVYLVRENELPVATGAASPVGDTDFWTPAELAEPAIYLSKVAVARDHAGGLGTLLIRWLTDRAALQGADWVRLDAWRTNRGLHAYYDRTGWTYVRTVEREHRRSGALFQRPAIPDPEARAAFRDLTQE